MAMSPVTTTIPFIPVKRVFSVDTYEVPLPHEGASEVSEQLVNGAS